MESSKSNENLYSRVPPFGADVLEWRTLAATDSLVQPLGRADLHLHTRASDGLMSACDLVDHVERCTDLDVIAITDHDETSGALAARERAARNGYRVEVIPGVEVTTRDGHLVA